MNIKLPQRKPQQKQPGQTWKRKIHQTQQRQPNQGPPQQRQPNKETPFVFFSFSFLIFAIKKIFSKIKQMGFKLLFALFIMLNSLLYARYVLIYLFYCKKNKNTCD